MVGVPGAAPDQSAGSRFRSVPVRPYWVEWSCRFLIVALGHTLLSLALGHVRGLAGSGLPALELA
jgi:hypothetical protein